MKRPILEQALDRERLPVAFTVRLHADRLRPHIEGLTPPSRRWRWVLEALEFLAGLFLAATVAVVAADLVGRLIAWLWLLGEHWGDLPQ